jgi:hypothetical protein
MPGAAVAGVAVRSTLPNYRRRRRRFSSSFAQAYAAGAYTFFIEGPFFSTLSEALVPRSTVGRALASKIHCL